jgi:uncharacterized protein YchJ
MTVSTKIFTATWALLFVLVTALVGCGGDNSTPSAAAKKQLEAMKKNDTQAIVDCFAPSVLKETGAKEKLNGLVAMGVEETKKKEGLASYEIIEEKINEAGDKATVKSKLTYGNGKTSTEKTRLVKEDGKWYISLK